MSDAPTSPTKPRIDFIEGWRKKAFEIPDGRTSAVITRSFEALKSMNGTDFNDLAYRAEEMKTARENTFKFDNSIASDPERRYFYGLSQSIELTCETLIARFRAEEQERKRRAQKAQVAQAAEAQAQAWAASQARAQAQSAPQGGAPGSGPLFADVKAEPVDEGMMVKMEDIDDAYDTTTMNNEQFLDFGMGTPNTSQDVINLSDDDSDGIPVPIRRPRGLSVKTLSCPRCTATNMNISAFVKHLTDLHKTTPVKEKVAFLCGCSFTGTNYTEVRRHALNCHNTITVIPRGPL